MRVILASITALLLASGGAVADDGAALFAKNCLMCHQSGAAGLPGQFPRLAGRVGPLAGKPEGRAYLIDVLTYGMAGSITVDQQPIIGVMPSFQLLSDEDVAALLTYLRDLGGPEGSAFSAGEVAEGRAKPHKSPSEVLRERKALALQ